MNSSRKLIYVILVVAGILCVSCSGNSSGPDEPDSDAVSGEGELNVAGDIDTQHQGLSQYIGLRTSGEWANLTLSITQHPLGSEEVNDFNFAIRMVGDGGPFQLETGEFNIGENPGGPLIIASYSNRVISNDTVLYSADSNTTGSITILSVSETSIEATFDIERISNSSGSVNISGELSADCYNSPGANC